jgi:hypothetical protein
VLAAIDPKPLRLVLDFSAEGKKAAVPPASITKEAKPADVKGLPRGVEVQFVRPKKIPVKFVKKEPVP